VKERSAGNLLLYAVTFDDQGALEDDTDAATVLFLTRRSVELPVVLELRDRAGRTIARRLELELGHERG
jgi:hypothetical protein